MSREMDKRDYNVKKLTPAREEEFNKVAATVSDQLPGSHRVKIARFDPRTGNPGSLRSEAAPAETGDYVQRALDHVRGIGQALGLTSAQAAEFAADPNYQKTSS